MPDTQRPLVASVRLGILGAGHIGAVHCRHAARLDPNLARLIAVADTHLAKAEALAATVSQGNKPTYQGAVAVDTIEALLNAKPDAVIVAVPTHAHRAAVETCLRAGVAVLCEKPMALTLEDCDAMLAVANTTGTLLTVGQTVRFFPEFANAKRLITSGAIGEPAAVRTRRAGRYPATDWFADTQKSGGLLLDLLVHDFDFLQWCFGPVVRVHALQASYNTRSDEATALLDYVLVTLRHVSGVIAHVEGFWGDPLGFHTAFEIAGDKGMLTHDSRRAATLIRSQAGVATAAASTGPLYPQDDPYFQQLTAFVEAVRNGTPPGKLPSSSNLPDQAISEGVRRIVTGQEARQAVAVALAARESVRTGQAVTL